jgi:hypothetical protein
MEYIITEEMSSQMDHVQNKLYIEWAGFDFTCLRFYSDFQTHP